MGPELDRAKKLIEQADGLLITAGAGMGVDSGLPDFRGNEGFWRAYPGLAKAGIGFTSIASPQAFRAQPAVAWGFYGHRLRLYRETVPHAGFGILKSWGERTRHGCQVFTSNVDGHFERAGFDSGRVSECHGSIHHLQCLRRCTQEIWGAEAFAPEIDDATGHLTNPPPLCPHCGGLARPNILMFNDGEWLSARTDAQQVFLTRWLRQVERPVVIELGAGTAIPTVRNFGERLGRAGGVPLIRINLREPQVPAPNDVSLAFGALEALLAIRDR